MALRHMMGIAFRKEAAMAAITFNSAERLRHPLPATMGQPTKFQPLDPDIVSASIPAFFIGRNRAGFWVAREANGRMGGIFLFKSSAVRFAHVQSAPAKCALIFPSETFELDIENRGNPLITQVARWTDRARRRLAQLAAR
jgi:hypothetical protein